MSTSLDWLPPCLDFAAAVKSIQDLDPEPALRKFKGLANSQMDFVSVNRLDRIFQKYLATHSLPPGNQVKKLAILGSSTLAHLVPGIRVGALRHGIIIDLRVGDYGSYRQELFTKDSWLYAFEPDVVLLALDADHVGGPIGANADSVIDTLEACWKMAKSMGAIVLQQTLLPRAPELAGNNEFRFPQSPAAVVQEVNYLLRKRAQMDGVYLLSLDHWVAQFGGVSSWFDPALWYLSKQEVRHTATPLYGEQVGRLLGALWGRSAKCLVLDLDNTIWGGVIGDEGIHGIVLGQGTAAGESFVALQRYAKRLSERGILLAVCSKNDEANALAPFKDHPEMVLKESDISCFRANWQDKAQNLRQISKSLNIGLDSLVFVDDNPVERALIRRELLDVRVPELPEEPEGYLSTVVRAGYFEAVEQTAEDLRRVQLYRDNANRQALLETATDITSFLATLNMELTWAPFDPPGLKRIAQLINKTNQFNLTTRRYTETDILNFMEDEARGNALTFQFSLKDIYGENGIIALVIGRVVEDTTLEIDTWLMSCRVLGREVERATLSVVAHRALELGCTTLIGRYEPSEKNAIVKDLYSSLDFEEAERLATGAVVSKLRLQFFVPGKLPITILQGGLCKAPMSISS